MAKGRSVTDKIKDVVTLKTAQENFFQNDGSLTQFFAHGATEAANMVLHGHPAPVYAGYVSPPDLVSTEIVSPGIEPEPMQMSAQVEQTQEVSFLSQTMQEIQQRPEINDPEMELAQ